MSTQKQPNVLAVIVLLIIVLNGVLFSQTTVLSENTKPLAFPQGSNIQPSRFNLNRHFSDASPLLKNADFSFLPDVQVNSDSGNVMEEREPVIAVSPEGIIYVAWKAADSLKSILFSRSLDGGKTFLPAVKINDDVNYPPSYGVFQPDIALDADGNIYVVWFDYRAWADDNSYTSPVDVYLSKSTDQGLTWGQDVKVSVGGAGTYPWHFQPYLAIDQNNGYIYVSFSDYDRYWPQNDPSDICVGRSVDGGLSFENKVRVDDCPDSLLAKQTFSYITVDSASGNVYVTFQDSRNGGTDIFMARSTDYGLSFGNNIMVNSDTTHEQVEASIKTDKSGTVYVVYNEWSPDTSYHDTTVYKNDIYLTKSIDNGDTFLEPVRVNQRFLNDSYGYNFPPRMAVDDSGFVHMVWYDHHKGFNTCNYSRSSDGGQTFSDAVMINDEMDSVSSALPRLALDHTSGIYAVWMDERNGNENDDIFFSRNVILTAMAGEETLRPNTYTLIQNYPNPFNPTTTIAFTLPDKGDVRLVIYDSAGRLVKVLTQGRLQAGRHTIRWNGLNASGVAAASGVYIYQLRYNGKTLSRKMLMLR